MDTINIIARPNSDRLAPEEDYRFTFFVGTDDELEVTIRILEAQYSPNRTFPHNIKATLQIPGTEEEYLVVGNLTNDGVYEFVCTPELREGLLTKVEGARDTASMSS